MVRLALALLLVAALARAEEPSRLGALLRTYLAEQSSVSRQEELLSEIRRVTGDDPDRVVAALRAGEHRRYPARPAFRIGGAPPLFKGRNFRCDKCADAIAKSAGQYAQLVLPPKYDRTQRYPLIVDIGMKPRPPEPGAVLVIVRPQRHPQAATEAVALERLVLGLIAHTMTLVPIDPERVILRGAGRYAELVWYIGFQNPDRFAGLFCGYDYWAPVRAQAAHGELFAVLAVSRGKNDAKLRKGMDELGRFSRRHQLVVVPDREPELAANLRVERARWQRATQRSQQRRRLSLVCVRPYPLRSHWIRLVPKTRSRREGTIARVWSHRVLPRPATMEARVDDSVRNLVHVKAKEVVAFQIYVDPRVFDVDKPLRVRINGKAPTAHIIEPDIGALLDDYREHGDPGLLYVARLSFP
ncbi:MAG: hypothetical protein ACYTEG_07805 [Planctomycetota bacterium]|jgi:hypothetical protein